MLTLGDAEMTFYEWFTNPTNINTNIFTLLTVILSGIISWIISAIYFYMGNRNNLKSSLFYPMKRQLAEPYSPNKYRLLEEIYRGYSAKYLNKAEKQVIDNLLAAYQKVCTYDENMVNAEILFSYFIYKLKKNNIDPQPVPFCIDGELIYMDYPHGLSSIKKKLESIIQFYSPEDEGNSYSEGKISHIFNSYCKEYYHTVKDICFFDDFSLEKVLEKSRIRNEWDSTIKSMEDAKKAFFGLKSLQ